MCIPSTILIKSPACAIIHRPRPGLTGFLLGSDRCSLFLAYVHRYWQGFNQRMEKIDASELNEENNAKVEDDRGRIFEVHINE